MKVIQVIHLLVEILGEASVMGYQSAQTNSGKKWLLVQNILLEMVIQNLVQV